MIIGSDDFYDLFEFYKKVNEKNGNKLNLSSYKVDTDVAEGEKNIAYSLKEDVIEEIIEDLEELKAITKDLKSVDTSQAIDEIVSDYQFKSNLVKLIGIYGHLSAQFEDFYDFHVEFLKSLPEMTKEDSERI
ncbi:hypothetical protein [Enterococcus rivorum]|uniref:Uncharacterized protein n=1 Tax=Enterococcus rivorum TaxID=762845 RepID=A0A1E5L0V1_9ENTE|nr:hypothetical protein [Enterococcus rivorum]MBP2098624.1 hypothetical protein [Enterococcus rivorum]OEH83725.1 hypothetical protein BCR26_07830 [Enterococcus rivorum]